MKFEISHLDLSFANVWTYPPTRAHTTSLHIYHHFQCRCGCNGEKEMFIQFSTRSSNQIGIRNLSFDSPMAKASPSSQRKCAVVPRFQSDTSTFLLLLLFSGGTFINHLILWNKKQPAHSTVFEFVSEWMSACFAYPMRISQACKASDLVHIYFMAITLYCKILYNSHKFSHFLIRKGYIYTAWMGSMTLAVGCWIGAAIFCACLCALCSALFGPALLLSSSSSFFAPLLVAAAFIFRRIGAYKTWMIICVLYAGWFCYWMAEPPHQKGYAQQQTATEMGDIAVVGSFFCLISLLIWHIIPHTYTRIRSLSPTPLSRSPAHNTCILYAFAFVQNRIAFRWKIDFAIWHTHTARTHRIKDL